MTTATEQGFEVLRAEGEDLRRWCALMDDWPGWSVFADPAWLGLFAEEGVEPVCAVYAGPDGRVVQPLLLRDLRATGWWDGEAALDTVSPPHGYAGPFVVDPVDDEAGRVALLERFFAGQAAWAREHGLVSEYVNFDPRHTGPIPYPGDVVARMPTVVRDLTLDPDDLWMDYEHKVRKNVKRARKHGLEFEVDREGRRLDAFLDIYYGTMDRQHAAEHFYFPRSFFEAILERVPHGALFVHVLHGGEVVSTELVLVSGDSLFSFLGGTRREAFRLRANDYLKHAVHGWGREHGYTTFVIGGGYGGHDPLFRYKRSFAPNGVRDLRVGRWLVDEARYERLMEARRRHEAARGVDWRPRPGFFPAYRAPAAPTEAAEEEDER
ncbi:MAG: lipid II:glycine glycyltransferase FemX [Myxococcota bacterium]